MLNVDRRLHIWRAAFFVVQCRDLQDKPQSYWHNNLLVALHKGARLALNLYESSNSDLQAFIRRLEAGNHTDGRTWKSYSFNGG